MNKKIIFTALLAIVAIAGHAQKKQIVWEQPTTEFGTSYGDGFFNLALDMTKVELKTDETLVYVTAQQRSNYPEASFQFVSDTYLKVGDQRYTLISADGIELDKFVQTNKDGRREMVFHFPPLPKDTKSFDFIEGDNPRAFQIKGIKPVEERWKQLFPSYWRNAQGDWKIAFFEDCAIYDCKFWDYKQCNVNPKTGEATMVLANGNDELKIVVGKNKKGTRTIQIGKEKADYSMITSRFLPDYPTKDTRTAFKDTHYKTDTVTLIGWLKDMPQQLKDKGDVFDVYYENIFSDKQMSIPGKIDSLGRFVAKVPLLNSSMVIFDGNRTYIFTLFEPGETYFLLYDFKEGRRFYMGNDVRLQNELLKYPMAMVRWRNEYPEEKLDETGALQLLESLKQVKEGAMEKLNQVVAEHPNISDRYFNFMKGFYNTREGRELMQGRFDIKDHNVPAEYMNYVHRQHWQQRSRPYTLYSDFCTFRRDYINQLNQERYAIKMPIGGFLYTYTDMEVPTLRRYRDAGKVSITDDELAAMENFANNRHPTIRIFKDEEEAEKWEAEHKEYQDNYERVSAITKREDIKKVLETEQPLFPLYHTLAILDSLDCDKDLCDIIIVSELYGKINQNRQPLTDFVMQYVEENVSMEAAKEFLRAEQEKYLALQNKDFANAASLRPSTDVENMTDGEKILRKIIEPYKGRIIYVDIWGTWCGPCKEALSHSQQMYERLKDYDIVYLYLANRSSEESWKNVIKEYNLTGENCVHYNLPADQQSAIERYVGVNGYPTYKIIDKDGNIHDLDWLHHEDLEAFKKIIEKFNQ